MTSTGTPTIDLLSLSSYASGQPFDQFRWLREHDPVHWHREPKGPGFWAITRYNDVRTVSRTPATFSSYQGGIGIDDPDPANLAAQRMMMLTMDPPRHDRFKLLVSSGFTPKNSQDLSGRIHELAVQIIDNVIERRSCDLVEDIAGVMPSYLIAELMGIPRADGVRLYDLTEKMHTTDNTVVTPEQRAAAFGEMLTYAQEVFDAKRRQPSDDIASTLVQAEVDGERLTDDELQWFFLLLINAGGDTTRNLVSAGTELLFEHPDQRALLVSDLDRRLPAAIEEMLRYTSPVVHFRRTASRDVTLSGREIKAGDKVVVFYGSANRDDAVFDRPDTFDITRDPNPHLAFGGGGPHLCLGMHVARIEIHALMHEMFTRLPRVERDGPTERLASNFIAGIRHLPVRW